MPDHHLRYLDALFGTDEWPGPLRVARAARLVSNGTDLKSVIKEVRSTKARVEPVLSAPDPVEYVLGVSRTDVSADHRRAATASLSTLLLGRAAEVAFEDIYKEAMHTEEIELDDLREGRSDTDYVLLDGKKRKLFRLNIKFFGSYFRRAVDLVGLETEDCFPLATYKIHAAVAKQRDQHLPYVFLIVGVQDLNTAAIAGSLPRDDIEFLAMMKCSERNGLRMKDFEDRIVTRLHEHKAAAFTTAYERIKSAPWYVLSAQRADNLLRKLLFERVFAVRVKSFTSAFRNAEVDMHFSLKSDLLPLPKFFDMLKEEGVPMMTAKLTSGTI